MNIAVVRRTVRAETEQANQNLSRTVAGLVWWLVLSGIIVLLYAIAIGTLSASASVAMVLHEFSRAALNAGWALAAGALTGFLFGIPRTLQRDEAPSGKTQAVNTNLEQISDWLTKILVGVGLTQLQRLPDDLWRLGQTFPLNNDPALGIALFLNFVIAGFFCGYLLTRLFLTGAFEAVEKSLSVITERAGAFEKAGQFGQALSEYERALDQITSTTAKGEKRRIYEGLIFNSLYAPPPEGFDSAIRYAERYNAEEPTSPSATILAYLAAANGQKFLHRQDEGAGDAALAPIREQALRAVSRALQVDPAVKPLLQMMFNPRHPVKSPGDDDLEVFFGDPEFRALLGE